YHRNGGDEMIDQRIAIEDINHHVRGNEIAVFIRGCHRDEIRTIVCEGELHHLADCRLAVAEVPVIDDVLPGQDFRAGDELRCCTECTFLTFAKLLGDIDFGELERCLRDIHLECIEDRPAIIINDLDDNGVC